MLALHPLFDITQSEKKNVIGLALVLMRPQLMKDKYFDGDWTQKFSRTCPRYFPSGIIYGFRRTLHYEYLL